MGAVISGGGGYPSAFLWNTQLQLQCLIMAATDSQNPFQKKQQMGLPKLTGTFLGFQ